MFIAIALLCIALSYFIFKNATVTKQLVVCEDMLVDANNDCVSQREELAMYVRIAEIDASMDKSSQNAIAAQARIIESYKREVLIYERFVVSLDS